MSSFAETWQRHHGNAPPLSFAMRAESAEHWLRFHALPASKRYPASEAEQQIVLTRANILARAVLGEGDPCWLVQAGDWGEPALGAWDYEALHHHDEFDWQIRAALTTFQSNAFDALLLGIADETARRTLWMNANNGSVFAPYDGGFDLFLKSAEEVRFLKARHADWLSNHPDGL